MGFGIRRTRGVCGGYWDSTVRLRFVDLVDAADLEPEALSAGPQEGVERVRAVGPGARKSRAKSGPGGVELGDVERGKWCARGKLACAATGGRAEGGRVRLPLGLASFPAAPGRLVCGASVTSCGGGLRDVSSPLTLWFAC